mmetsp:Transcript_14491/g.40195  ORF Transcript_14491/g.40195 Transcript_14491/m.40195 type:complete len:203 (-) Transcript_14491:467-1075(-)
MMGPNMTDFSSFGYVFAHCKRRGKKRVHKQLSGFLKTNEDDIDDPVLKCLIQDMIEKTKHEALEIDPLENSEAEGVLEELVSNTPMTNPGDAFVPFISEQSTNKLQAQVSRMVTRASQSLEIDDFPVSFSTLEELENLNNVLSHQETHGAVGEAKRASLEWAHLRLCRVESLEKDLALCDNMDNYGVLAGELHTLYWDCCVK